MIALAKPGPPAPVRRPIRLRIAAAVALLGAALAAAPEARAQGSTLVQIGGLKTPAVGSDGQRTETMVTLFLEVPNLAAAVKACERLPQLRDAYVRLTHARPFPSLGRMVDSSALESDIANAFDNFLGKGMVREVFAMTGTPVESAGPMTRDMHRQAKSLPPEGMTLKVGGEDCRPINALPPDAEDQMRAQRSRRIAAAHAAGRVPAQTPARPTRSVSVQPPDAEPFQATSPWFWAAFVGGLVVLFGGAGAMYWLISRRRAATRRRQAERRMVAAERRQGDRRTRPDPNYAGPERRQGERRSGARRDGTDRRAGEDRRR